MKMGKGAKQTNSTMKTIAALSISGGLALPPLGSVGRILSVHKDYVNILINNAVIAIVRQGRSLVPFGIEADLGEVWDFIDTAGEQAVYHYKGRLIVGDGVAVIGLEDCRRYSCHPAGGRPLSEPEVTGRLELLYRYCHQSARDGGIVAYLGHYRLEEGALQKPERAGLIERRLQQRFEALVTGVRRNDAFLIVEGVLGLLGVGPGLTPSGDDFLVGFLAGLAHCGGDACARPAAAITNCLLQNAAACTTSLSAEYIRYATRGQYHQFFTAFIDSFQGGGAEELAAQTARLLTLGHSSGTDLLLGFVYGGMTAQSVARKDADK